jgi:hypothetical protein
LSTVTAIVVGARAHAGTPLAGEGAAAVVEARSLAGIREAARATQDDLVWVLGPGAVPLADTLPALLAAAHTPAASLPVDDSAAPVEAAIGRFAEDDVPALLEAASRHQVPLRHTRVASLLVDREAVLAQPPPDPRRFGLYAGNEWTGRLFAGSRGMLVPASRVRLAAAGRGSPIHALRAARAGGWGKGETLRELHRALAGR